MEEREIQVRIILPSFNEILGGFSCAKEWCKNNHGHACGCPKCLGDQSLTLVYDVEDFRSQKDCPDPFRYEWMWRRRVVQEKYALVVPELIVPGYPGAVRERS